MSANAKQHITQLNTKIRNLIVEFSDGRISAEQFNILYERYSNQLSVVASLSGDDDDDAPETPGGDMSTIAIRQATTAQAVGLGIYHHRSGIIIETLGAFDLPPSAVASILNEFSDKLEKREYIEPRVQRAIGGLWLVFIARSYTTAILIFRNQPSKQQLTDMQRLHHDFEEANRRLLDAAHVQPKQLARPFIGFVKKRLAGGQRP